MGNRVSRPVRPSPPPSPPTPALSRAPPARAPPPSPAPAPRVRRLPPTLSSPSPFPPLSRAPASPLSPAPVPRVHRLPSPLPLPTRPDVAQDAGEFRSRELQYDARQRLDRSFSTETLTPDKDEDAQKRLIRAGFIRQAYSGIFHVLPLGLRVQNKICRLIESEMRKAGADMVQLSALTSQKLWQMSGRLDNVGSELFRLDDRRGHKFLLSPTHEEAITILVCNTIGSHTKLPIRLYQITQKYRDELRPRQGLLRTRDFLMKDLYTFDYDVESALETYEEVRAAYARIFIDKLKLPMLVAEASSGNMGGSLSHEYHIPTNLGEDHVISCDYCGYVANEEVAEARSTRKPTKNPSLRVWRGISKCRTTIVNVWYGCPAVGQPGRAPALEASNDDINLHAVKKVFPDLDSGVNTSKVLWEKLRDTKMKVVNLFDATIAAETRPTILAKGKILPSEFSPFSLLSSMSDDTSSNNFLRIRKGDTCVRCSSGSLKVTKAIELGHTFHLGTRYSAPMGASVTNRLDDRNRTIGSPAGQVKGEMSANDVVATKSDSTHTTAESRERAPRVTMQMGCHGIGISRLMGAVANHFAGPNKLAWPSVIAPYEAVILTRAKKGELELERQVMEDIYDGLAKEQVDVVIDDQPGGSVSRRFAFYDLIGIPIWVILGKEWTVDKLVEVRCPQMKYRTLVRPEVLPGLLKQLLANM